MRQMKKPKGNEWYALVEDAANGGAFTCYDDGCVGRSPCWNVGNNLLTKGLGMGIHKLGKFQTNLVPCVICGHKGTMHHRGHVWQLSQADNQGHEVALKQAEKIAKDAEASAKAIKDQAEEARKRQEEADKAARQAETQRMNALMEDARREKELAEDRTKAAKEEAQKEREQSQKLREDAEKANDQRRKAEAGKALADKLARVAANKTKKAMAAKEDAEKRLKEGIQPVLTPSPAQVAAAKERIEYQEDCFHFAIAGGSGSGKSSLVNAFRGLRSRDEGAAAVGVTETTLRMKRYPDADPENPYVWYDIPGAGTLKCRDWLYFNEQGLYVFDCIIVVTDNRFTMTDVAILLNARRFNIPTYIVRSKADQHINNVMMDMRYNGEGDGEEDEELRDKAARKFIDETRESVKANLKRANLQDQRVYIVSNRTLTSLVLNGIPEGAIDEVELLCDLMNEAEARRKAAHDAS